jgi:argininosuccinate synthase
MEVFLESTQQNVNGKVFVRLHPYRFELLGIESPNDLMNSAFGHYGEESKGYTGDEVKGFTAILGNAQKIYFTVNQGS